MRQFESQLIHLFVETYKYVESGHEEMHLD